MTNDDGVNAPGILALRQAVDHLGEQAVIDLTVLSGTYVMVSMLLNATQVGIPNGGALPLEVLDPVDIRQRLLAA